MDQPKKYRTRYVIVERGEGPTAQCRKPVLTKTVDEANKVLADWARTAPKEGGYDKCDFVVIGSKGPFGRGYEVFYDGRFDLENRHTHGQGLLQDHMRGFWEMMAGITIPRHFKPGDAERMHEQNLSSYGPNYRDEIKDMLDHWDMA